MDNNDGPDDQFDEAFEREIQDSTVWVGDGYFIDQSWVSLGETKPVEPAEERPLVLHTCLRHPHGHAEAGRSFAHDRHPFAAFVHLLDNALPGSDVFMSIPFLGDFDAIDQLCHYASPQFGGLQIYIILGPKHGCRETLEKFVGRSESRETAVKRLHIKPFGHDNHASTATYSHSKAMVCTAGAMIGSYNYTAAARLRHTEHAVLLGPDSDLEGMKVELAKMWRNIPGTELKFSRTPLSPTKFAPPPPGELNNPYEKQKNTK
jgi:hypothetical protein